MISAQSIKDLREKTGAGISDIKKALEESGGDMTKALSIIERRLGGIALKKAGRETHAGIVDAYVHSNGRIGSMVEIFCETDFVARNPQFREFAHDIAMHVAAMSPAHLSLDTIPQEMWQAEKSRIEGEVRDMKKPESVLQEIVDGKLKAHFGPMVLLSQTFVKDQDKTVGDFINEAIGKFGENIKVGKFVRFEL